MEGEKMKWLPRTWIFVTTLLLFVSGTTAYAEPPDHARVGAPVYEKLAQVGRVRVMIVLSSPIPRQGNREQLKRDVSRAQSAVLNALSSDHFTLERQFQAIPALAGEITSKGLQTLLTLPGVVRVDEDKGGRGSLLEAVPLTNADGVQALGFTGQGVTVAVLDSGIDTDHSDLGDDLVAEACFCSGAGTGGACCPNGSKTQFGPGAAEDDNGHGTHVSGIVTSAGVVAPIGAAPDAEIVAIKVLAHDGIFCCTSDIVAGLDWIIVNRPDVDIVNMSLGTFDLFSGECDESPVPGYIKPLVAAIDTLRSLGVLTFVSAGNDASGTEMNAPACIANAISVGAVYDSDLGGIDWGDCVDPSTSADQVVCFSNSNETTDLFAPGADITSDYLFNTTATWAGTSMASPHAAACAADLLQADPSWTPDEIESALKLTGVPVTDPKNGLTFPRIDCLQALGLLESMGLCGDGSLDPGEECDDGNVIAGDGCSPICQFEGEDTDGDGVPDEEDACPNSILDPTVVIDGCDSQVSNALLSEGCTISDEIEECAANSTKHGAFRRCVSKLGDGLQKDGVLTGPEKERILSCAGQAEIP
jgi:cysteine-rich repeat protein